MIAHTRRLFWGIGLVVVVVAVGSIGERGGGGRQDVVPIGVFSEMEPAQALPGKWQSLTLAAAYTPTTYDLVRRDGTVVVRARSASSTSAIGIEHRVDLTRHPVLEWRWRVGDIVERADLRRKKTFDAPARVVVDFEYDDFSLIERLKMVAFRALGYDLFPKRSIMYVWTNRMKLHEVAPTPHADWIKMVAVRRGSTQVDTWHTERRNVLQDYRRIFGEEPPPVHGVAFMTDTNSVGDTLTAYYGDIVFRAAPSDSTVVDTTLHGLPGASD